MQFSTLALALTGAAVVSAQAVTSAITPTGAAPAGCTGSVSGNFEITVYNTSTAATKRDLSKRAACGSAGTLVITLKDGILTDNKARTGYIAENYQFQFDGPPQAGAKFTAGFSSCANSSLALGSSEVFYRCRSGSFYNLYNENWAPQCEAVAIGIIPCGDGSSSSAAATTPAATAATDGQPQATTAVKPAVTQITDGQPQANSVVVPVSQYTDGQIQMPTAIPVAQITDGQIQASSAAPSAPVATAPASNATTSPIAPATGAGSFVAVSSAAVALFAGLAAAALL